MKFKAHRPRLLDSLLLLIVGVSAATVILAAEERYYAGPPDNVFPTFGGVEVPAKEEQDDAVSIVKSSGIVESVNGNQVWSASRFAMRR